MLAPQNTLHVQCFLDASLRHGVAWGSRGRRFKSCRPDWLKFADHFDHHRITVGPLHTYRGTFGRCCDGTASSSSIPSWPNSTNAESSFLNQVNHTSPPRSRENTITVPRSFRESGLFDDPRRCRPSAQKQGPEIAPGALLECTLCTLI